MTEIVRPRWEYRVDAVMSESGYPDPTPSIEAFLRLATQLGLDGLEIYHIGGGGIHSKRELLSDG